MNVINPMVSTLEDDNIEAGSEQVEIVNSVASEIGCQESRTFPNSSLIAMEFERDTYLNPAQELSNCSISPHSVATLPSTSFSSQSLLLGSNIRKLSGSVNKSSPWVSNNQILEKRIEVRKALSDIHRIKVQLSDIELKVLKMINSTDSISKPGEHSNAEPSSNEEKQNASEGFKYFSRMGSDSVDSIDELFQDF